MHSAAMGNGSSRLAAAWSGQSTAKFFRLSHLRKLRTWEQVAAICYRVRGGSIEFLLVRTRGRRWTFPKGSAEPGLTHAQAAALEAFEEAGVHGRIEEASFAHYITTKGGDAGQELAVSAHLCEVTRLERSQEPGRNPTWFSADKAKLRLSDDRTDQQGAELARVVDRAVSRVRRQHIAPPVSTEALKNVQFIDRPRAVASPLKASSDRKRAMRV